MGKTTTAINLAASLALLGKKVLLLDADPQANATSGLGFDINLEGIYECIAGLRKPEEVILQSPDVKNLWLLPSSIDLVAADTELPKLEDAHHVMKRIVDAVRERFDYIFIDCSPSLGYTTVNILTAADTVLIPVQCEYLALEGLSKLLNTIRKVKSGLNPALDIEGFLLTMYMRNRLNNQVVNEVREHFGPLAYDTIIQRNIRLGEAPSHGKPVMLYDAGAVGSENYLNLAREFLKRNRKPKITYRNKTAEGIRARTGRHIRHRRRRRQAQADEPDVRDRHHGDHSQPRRHLRVYRRPQEARGGYPAKPRREEPVAAAVVDRPGSSRHRAAQAGGRPPCDEAHRGRRARKVRLHFHRLLPFAGLHHGQYPHGRRHGAHPSCSANTSPLEGLLKLLNTIRKVKSGLNPALDIEGFLLTMYMRNRLNNQVVTEVREHFGELAYDTIIQRNIRLGEAPSHGKPVMLYDARAPSARRTISRWPEFLKRNRKPRK